jgi:hypothetical protein
LVEVIGVQFAFPSDRYLANDRNLVLRLITGESSLICLRGFARHGVAIVALIEVSTLPRNAPHRQAADVAAGHLTGSAVRTRPSLADLDAVAGVAAGTAVAAVGVLINAPVRSAAERGAGLGTPLAAGAATTESDHARGQPVARALVAALTAVGLIRAQIDALATAVCLTI